MDSEESDNSGEYADKCIASFRCLLEDIGAPAADEDEVTLWADSTNAAMSSSSSQQQPPPTRMPFATAGNRRTFAPPLPPTAAQPRPPQSQQPKMGGDDIASAAAAAAAASSSPLFSASRAEAAAAKEAEEAAVAVVQRRPQPLPKPQLDIVRYSMANADSEDLDSILKELLAFEDQLNGDEANQLLLGITPIASTSSSQQKIAETPIVRTQIPQPVIVENPQVTRFVAVRGVAECRSPDNDSAYGDSSSTECSSGSAQNRNSEFSSAESFRGSLSTPSPTNQTSPNDAKALRIREALEKMKEAKMKRIYVKFFLENNETQGLLIDERWTVAETMRQLASKLNIVLTPEHSIVEEYPHLHIRRIYEDNEFVVENIELWLADSKNKLHFCRRMDKFCFIHSPQHYLITEKTQFDYPAVSSEWTGDQKSELWTKFVENEGMVPELEGYLQLKADGKKSWKKHYFVLRSSGLYYCPKGKKGAAKDLQCLMTVYNNQIYTCTDWRKKYKAPSGFGFAIKHPNIQVKSSKYIKYVCTEDEKTFRRWIAALRIAKNGCSQLEKNFRESIAEMQKAMAVPTEPLRPRVLSRALDSQRSSVASSSKSDPPLTAFDQDDCGTIKRNPQFAANPMNSSSTSTFNGFCRQTPSPLPPTPSRMSSRQMSASDHLSQRGTPIQDNGDSDSDEEQFPPPPPEVLFDRPRRPPVEIIHRPVEMNQRSAAEITHRSAPIPQNFHQREFQRIPETQQMQVEMQLRQLESQQGYADAQRPMEFPQRPKELSNRTEVSHRPPPPPKRSDKTRLLQSPDLITEQHKQQMDLFTELQEKLRRQNRQIEG